MRHKFSNLDGGRAWTEATALFKAQPDLILTIGGFFVMLPALLLDMLRPFQPSGARETWMQELLAWMNVNFHWVVITAVLAALGRLIILILLLSPERPTVGQAIGAGARLLLPFVVMDLIIGFLLLGGFFVFILPMLYIFGRTFMAEVAFVALRAHGPTAPLKASVEASRGNGWRIFVVAAIVYVAGMILTAAVSSVLGVIGALAGGNSLSLFLTALAQASLGAGVSIVLLLMSISFWQQAALAHRAPA